MEVGRVVPIGKERMVGILCIMYTLALIYMKYKPAAYSRVPPPPGDPQTFLSTPCLLSLPSNQRPYSDLQEWEIHPISYPHSTLSVVDNRGVCLKVRGS